MSGIFGAMLTGGWTVYRMSIPTEVDADLHLEVFENNPGEWEVGIDFYIGLSRHQTWRIGRGATLGDALRDLIRFPGSLADADLPAAVVALADELWTRVSREENRRMCARPPEMTASEIRDLCAPVNAEDAEEMVRCRVPVAS